MNKRGAAPRSLRRHCATPRIAAGVRQHGGRQRPTGVRRVEFRHGCRGRGDRRRPQLRGGHDHRRHRRGDRRDPRRVMPDETEAVYDALVLGTRDYIRKCGFKRVLLGLSGGIDSTLVACVAADAVGPENVAGVAMPGPLLVGPFSISDARTLAANLGIRFEIAPINDAYEQLLASPRAAVQRRAAGRHRREHSGAPARADPDGAVEQVERASCSPPATRAKWRSATARSTATCAAAWQSSATCPRRWFTTCAAP